MASQPTPPEIPSSFRFEFDPANKILLLRYEGRLTEESFKEVYKAIREYSTATDARAGIWDLTSVTGFDVSSEFVCHMADLEPAMRMTNALALSLPRRHMILVYFACSKPWESLHGHSYKSYTPWTRRLQHSALSPRTSSR